MYDSVSRFLSNPCITESTRIVDTNKPSLLGNIVVSNINNLASGNIREKISYDHLPNFVLIEVEITHNMKMNIKTRDMKYFNKENFITELHNWSRNQSQFLYQWLL